VGPVDRIALLESLLAEARASVQADQLSENQREETDDGTAKGNAMCRIDGPFKHHSKYRVRVVDRETSRTSYHTYQTQQEARDAIPVLRKEYRRPEGVPVSQALEAYAGYLATRRMSRARTIETTMQRVRSLFQNGEAITDDLTKADVNRWWSKLKTTPGHRSGKLPFVDTLVGVLKQSKTFVVWMVGKGWTKRPDLLADIAVHGKRKRGKPQLRIDDARKYEAHVRELADKGDVGAIAALVPLYMGNRAGEVVSRRVRDLDDRGTLLHIEYAKTEAGNRPLDVPEVLQPFLRALAKGKQPDAALFTGSAPRARMSLEALTDPVAWLRRQVWRMCKLASRRWGRTGFAVRMDRWRLRPG